MLAYVAALSMAASVARAFATAQQPLLLNGGPDGFIWGFENGLSVISLISYSSLSNERVDHSIRSSTRPKSATFRAYLSLLPIRPRAICRTSFTLFLRVGVPPPSALSCGGGGLLALFPPGICSEPQRRVSPGAGEASVSYRRRGIHSSQQNRSLLLPQRMVLTGSHNLRVS
jgi:hypothetical protein